MNKILDHFLSRNAKAAKDYFLKELGCAPENKKESDAIMDYIRRENGINTYVEDFEAQRKIQILEREKENYFLRELGCVPTCSVSSDDFIEARIAKSINLEDCMDF